MQDLHSFSPFGALRHHLPPAVSVGRQKESAFMGRLGALLRPTCTSYAGCAQWTIKLREAVIPYVALYYARVVVPPLAGWQGNWIRREPLGD